MSAPTPSSSPRKDSRIHEFGKYQQLNHLATGGMGAVYKAWDPGIRKHVALKVLPPGFAAKPSLLKRFEREARNGLKLNHENIVKLYEFGEVKGIHYLAMEFVEGLDLHEFVQRKQKLSVRVSRAIILQAAKAIAHLHTHGIVHRDIKPSNFILTKRHGKPLIKLIDLGLARQVTDDEEARVTKAGSTLGTVDYIAPEQARDAGTADIRSDIYSLGCTWYHLLAGKAPFPEGSVTERIYKHIGERPPDIRQFNPQIPDEVVDILMRMLAKNPDDRYATPTELLRELEGKGPRRAPIQSDILAQLAVGENAHDEDERVGVAEVDEEETDESDWKEDEWDEARDQGAVAEKLDRDGFHWSLWLWVGSGTALLVLALVAFLIWWRK
jgi:serine/threonine-protein kinase